MIQSNGIKRAPAWLYRLRRFLRVRYVTINGFRLVAYRQDVPKHVSQVLVRGDYEMPERLAVSMLVRKNDRVLEIGSCIGFVAMTAARIVGAEHVLTFEPNPSAAKVARENFAMNGLPIELVTAAVGVSDGTLDLCVSPESWLGASARRGSEGNTVTAPMRSIVSVVDAFKPSVMVIDIEGMEEEVLGACPLADVRAVIVEVHPDVIGACGVRRLSERLVKSGFAQVAHLSSGETQTWTR